MEKYCISVDWLQTYCHCKEIQAGTYYGRGYTFDITESEDGTQLFKRLLKVRFGKMPIAIIQQCPRNEVIHPLSTCFKLENRVLYCMKFIEVLYALHEAVGATYKGITRLDLCYDCNRLHGGRSVERFIKQYVNAEPLKKGHIIRKGSSKFALFGSRNYSNVCRFNSIRWGSPKSAVGAYCYNKTLELLEVKDKPWIREMWEQNGLVSRCADLNMSAKEKNAKTEKDGLSDFVKESVWRFEISIKAEGNDILNMSTGELFRLSPEYLKAQPNIEKLFYIYAEKAFNFRINDGVKLIRNYKPIVLFEHKPEITSKPISLNKCNDSGRTEKICYNKLDKLMNTYTDLSEPRRRGLQEAMDFLLELQGKKSNSVRAERYVNYFANLKAHKFLEYEDARYIAAVQAAAAIKEEMTAMDDKIMFEVFYLGQPMTQLEARMLYAEAPDITPDEYIW